MQINDLIFRELIRRGYSRKKKIRAWDVSDSRLWYLTPELAEGFLNLKKFNPYRIRVINDEVELLKKHVPKIIKEYGKQKFNLIDLGCGSGTKAEEFIKDLPKGIKIRYCPVDISPFYINRATKRIKSLKSSKVGAVNPFISDFLDADYILGMIRNNEYQNNFALLLGETISHYDIHDLLFKISSHMFKGDYILIGNGIRSGKRFANLDTYKHPLFNDWFIHIMNGLGFKNNEVKIDVRFTNKKLEAYYNVLVNKKITHEGKSVYFKKGDEIVVATQFKYYERELKKYCKMYFSNVKIFKSHDGEHCIILCKK